MDESRQQYIELLEKLSSECPDTHIFNPLDGSCVLKDSLFGKLLINIEKNYKKTLENKKLLEKREYSIKSSGIKVIDFILTYIKNIDNVSELVSDDNSGYIYEFLWKLVISFGLVNDKFPLSKYQVMTGNVQLLNMKPIDLSNFLESNVISGNSGGYSDITLQKKTTIEHKYVCEPKYTKNYSSWIFFTSKFYRNERSPANDYDMHKLKSLTSIENTKYRLKYTDENNNPPRIVILVNNSSDFLDAKAKLRRSSQFLFKNFDDINDILDLSHLQFYYTKFKKLLVAHDYNFDNIISSISSEKIRLEPRLHQIYFLFRTIDCIMKNTQHVIIWGAIARSGKTFIMGELINYINTHSILFKNRCYRNNTDLVISKYSDRPLIFIIFSPVPNETIEQYIDMFTKYIEFDQFHINRLQGSRSIENFITNYVAGRNEIIIISKQSVDKFSVEDYNQNLIKIIRTIKSGGGNVDGIFFDEHHMGGSTPITTKILSDIKSINPDMFIIFITATYNKSLYNWKPPPENIITWDYEDIMLCKNLTTINIGKLTKKHGNQFEKSLECLQNDGYSIENIEYLYRQFPNIYLLTNYWNVDNVKRRLNLGHGDTLDISIYFSTNETDFNYPSGINNILDMIAGRPSEGLDIEDKNNINTWCFFERIRQLCISEQSRFPFSQLWFLPYGKAHTRINNVSKLLVKYLNAHPVLNKYSVLNLNDIEDTTMNLGDLIYEEEILAKEQNKMGLIILSGKKASMGISLPCVDVVVMLNSIKELDLYYQMIFRALTESQGKKCGFLVDFHPERTISAIYGQTFRQDKIGNPKDDIRDVIFNRHLLYLDFDILMSQYLDERHMINLFNSLRLTDLDGKTGLKSIGVDELHKMIIDNINRIELPEEVYSVLQRAKFNEIEFAKGKKISVDVVADRAKLSEIKEQVEDDIQELISNGASKRDAEQEVLNRKTKRGEKRPKEIIKDLEERIKNSGKMVFDLGYLLTPFIKIIVFITIDKQFETLEQILDFVFRDNPNVCGGSYAYAIKDYFQKMGVFTHQQIDILLDLVNPSSSINIVSQLSTISASNNNIQHIKEFRDYVVENGEDDLDSLPDDDFTKALMARCKNGNCDNIPNLLDKKLLLEYIKDNLKPIDELKKGAGEVFTPWELVDEMMKTIPEEFWNNPHHKILEPASGFAPFAIWAYYKLMRSLKTIIPDKLDRHRHIIENMIYMAELNNVNVEICKQIFNPTGDLKLNLYCGDYLALNIRREWRVDGFDLICGNPPYNEGRKNLWVPFIETSMKILNKKKYLLFINPPAYRMPNHKLNTTLFNLQFIFIKIIDLELSSKLFSSSIRVDYYLLKNSKCKNTTDIIFEDNSIGKILLCNLPFLPNAGFNIYKKLFVLVNSNNYLNTLSNSEQHNQRKDRISRVAKAGFDYKVVNSINMKGVDYLYSKFPHSHQNYKKVIFSDAAYLYPIYDDGILGISEQCIYILVNNQLDGNIIIKYLNSNIIKYIVSVSKWQGYRTNFRIFHNIPDPLKLPDFPTDITDINLYKYFKITSKEALKIENSLGSRANKTPTHLLKTLDTNDLAIKWRQKVDIFIKNYSKMFKTFFTISSEEVIANTDTIEQLIDVIASTSISKYKNSYDMLETFRLISLIQKFTHRLINITTVNDWTNCYSDFRKLYKPCNLTIEHQILFYKYMTYVWAYNKFTDQKHIEIYQMMVKYLEK
jgi:hypothetical protein